MRASRTNYNSKISGGTFFVKGNWQIISYLDQRSYPDKSAWQYAILVLH
jgi:hypothetical protein